MVSGIDCVLPVAWRVSRSQNRNMEHRKGQKPSTSHHEVWHNPSGSPSQDLVVVWNFHLTLGK